VPFRADLGLAVDGCFCLVAYATFRAITGR
jgi:hypothetical protein